VRQDLRSSFRERLLRGSVKPKPNVAPQATNETRASQLPTLVGCQRPAPRCLRARRGAGDRSACRVRVCIESVGTESLCGRVRNLRRGRRQCECSVKRSGASPVELIDRARQYHAQKTKVPASRAYGGSSAPRTVQSKGSTIGLLILERGSFVRAAAANEPHAYRRYLAGSSSSLLKTSKCSVQAASEMGLFGVHPT
jgi:hypothetical protein